MPRPDGGVYGHQVPWTRSQKDSRNAKNRIAKRSRRKNRKRR